MIWIPARWRSRRQASHSAGLWMVQTSKLYCMMSRSISAGLVMLGKPTTASFSDILWASRMVRRTS